MKERIALLAFAITAGAITAASAQTLTPEITSWIVNTTNATGYGGIPSNVQQVQYSNNWVYISATCIPGYNIGPWNHNPNVPSNQNFVFKLTRNPQQNTGTPVATPLGHVGVWTNGVSIFNAKDAHTYNNDGVWDQNALAVEGESFDSCLGHPDQTGEYHHHVNPRCLYDDADSLHHSPIIGFAFDGYPVYGAYGYANADGSGGIRRMQSSYRLRNITDRTTLADGTQLAANQYGPAVSTQYPLGYYLEDFEYVMGLGDLDEHNGRYCVTPDYPNGTYAYFVTIDSALNPVYPYTVGPTYYGKVPPGNTGPGSGHNTITESVTTYDPTSVVTQTPDVSFGCQIYGNPATNYIAFRVPPCDVNNIDAKLYDALGRTVASQSNIQPSIEYSFDVRGVPAGTYYLRLAQDGYITTQKIVVRH